MEDELRETCLLARSMCLLGEGAGPPGPTPLRGSLKVGGAEKRAGFSIRGSRDKAGRSAGVEGQECGTADPGHLTQAHLTLCQYRQKALCMHLGLALFRFALE